MYSTQDNYNATKKRIEEPRKEGTRKLKEEIFQSIKHYEIQKNIKHQTCTK